MKKYLCAAVVVGGVAVAGYYIARKAFAQLTPAEQKPVLLLKGPSK